ncbi:MAG: hypothetical protein DRJ05_12695 [Bacteroidetes bacterium]|nr:MAG: hypothetical protein DRJ05_12695 [Bacteroidota bacterium]
MKKHKVKIDQDALDDIQDITDWYNLQQKGLGKRFQDSTIKQINSLDKYPYSNIIRYGEFRCMIIDKFPYMAHYIINKETNEVEVFAIINTSRNPEIWQEKTGK